MHKSEEIFYLFHRKGSFIDGVSDIIFSKPRGAVSASPSTFQIPLLTPPGLSYGVFFPHSKDDITLYLPRFLFFRSNIK